MQKYIVNKNKTLQEEIDAKHAQEYMTDSDRRWVEKLESQIKDESVFEQFDFLKDDDNWGETIDFSVEEIMELPVLGEVQPDLANEDCEEQDEPYKVDSTPNGVQFKQGLPNLVKAEPKENYVTQKDVELIDIASLFTDEEYADLY